MAQKDQRKPELVRIVSIRSFTPKTQSTGSVSVVKGQEYFLMGANLEYNIFFVTNDKKLPFSKRAVAGRSSFLNDKDKREKNAVRFSNVLKPKKRRWEVPVHRSYKGKPHVIAFPKKKRPRMLADHIVNRGSGTILSNEVSNEVGGAGTSIIPKKTTLSAFQKKRSRMRVANHIVK
ncbi:hypothetical protein BJ742DRAFT_739371 [Cladochytrium replicatum]|nr:hypothetical protein BJ742DRAFT_739371 [Cladochytrium replicatum]